MAHKGRKRGVERYAVLLASGRGHYLQIGLPDKVLVSHTPCGGRLTAVNFIGQLLYIYKEWWAATVAGQCTMKVYSAFTVKYCQEGSV